MRRKCRHVMRGLSALLVLGMSLSCVQQVVPPEGIYPKPDTGFIGRRLQQRLTTEQADVAVIFIGGFSEQVLTHLRRVYESMPPLPSQGKQVRAFYAWDGGRGCLLFHSTELIQKDLRAFLEKNPGADLVFVGHSYGGSAVMDVLRHLEAERGRTIVVTLDAVSCRARSFPRERAAGVDYWVNVYCEPYRHVKDLAAAVGGPWRRCEQADVNILFSGSERDLADRRYQHSQPLPLFEDRAPGHELSAYEYMVSSCNRLRVGEPQSRQQP